MLRRSMHVPDGCDEIDIESRGPARHEYRQWRFARQCDWTTEAGCAPITLVFKEDCDRHTFAFDSSGTHWPIAATAVAGRERRAGD